MFLLFIAAVAASVTDSVNIDLTRYYPSDSVEELDRAALLTRVDLFLRQPVTDLTTPGKLAGWLEAYEELLVGLQKHDAYVYVCAERDQGDKAHAAADDKLESELDRLNAGVEQRLAGIGAPTLHGLLDAAPALRPYRYFVTHALARAKHASENQKAVEVLAEPAIASLKQSYKSLRQHVLTTPADGGGGNGARDGAAARDAFLAKWAPYAREEAAFAAILIPLTVAQNGSAELQGFDGAPEAAYFRADLSPELVHSTLAAVRESSGVYTHYREVVAGAAARRHGVSQFDIHTWDLDSADS
jgi:oligoendopeptidase F